jgi:hypothetical protein
MQPMNIPGSQRATCRQRTINESSEPLAGRLGSKRGTARAARISHRVVKSRCAGKWGAWGRLSDEGPGQNNPDRSEGPWGKAARQRPLERWCTSAPRSSTQNEDTAIQVARYTKDGCKPPDATNSQSREGPSDIPALKPYWGKPAVRDFRGSGGNVGIIRSPVRATALPGR